MIHKEGYPTIFIVLSVIVLYLICRYTFFKWPVIVDVLIYALLAFMLFMSLWFFRMPERTLTYGKQSIVCPADGKIVIIEKVFEPEYFKDERLQISVFMSPLNVHVNRYPIDGKVVFYKYHPGKYLVAWHPKSSTLNERTTVVLKHASGKEVLVRQIAGAVARRIVCYTDENKEIKQCEELGFIKFGSRVDLFLPLDTDIKVVKNQLVKGGCDVLAVLKN